MLYNNVQFFTSCVRVYNNLTLWGEGETEETIERIKVSEPITVDERTVEEAQAVAYGIDHVVGEFDAFRFYDQNIVICDDKEILFGREKNFSGWFYIGKEALTKEELSQKYGDKFQKHLELWKKDSCGDKPWAFVVTPHDNLYPLYDADVVVVDDGSLIIDKHSFKVCLSVAFFFNSLENHLN